MVSGTVRTGLTVPATTRSVVGLWQRLNFSPLPHQHTSLGRILESGVGGATRPVAVGGGFTTMLLGRRDGAGERRWS